MSLFSLAGVWVSLFSLSEFGCPSFLSPSFLSWLLGVPLFSPSFLSLLSLPLFSLFLCPSFLSLFSPSGAERPSSVFARQTGSRRQIDAVRTP